MNKLKVILIGAGLRGKAYTDKMTELPDLFEVVAVAEPNTERRTYIQNTHNIEVKYCFESWEQILSLPKFADIAIISTMDRLHYEPAMKAIDLGYNILLEKPVAPTAKECIDIAKNAMQKGVKIMVCHVLRYGTYYKALKRILDSGLLGRIMSVEHTEEVGNLHQSHSFVRGNWGNSDKSTTMLLQKTCHDMDILQWLIGKDVRRIQSFGKLSYFTKENAPEGSPEYCYMGCPEGDRCFYNAVHLYYDDKDNRWFREAAAKKVAPTDDEVMHAIKTTQYGKCVFKCDNNVVDHQTVNIEFEDGITAVFNMNAFCQGGRRSVFMGTKGELTTSMRDAKASFYDFATKETRELDLLAAASDGTILDGHGGGDKGIVCALYDYVSGKLSKEEVSEIEVSCKNHMIVFAAEKSREEGCVIDMDAFMKSMYEGL